MNTANTPIALSVKFVFLDENELLIGLGYVCHYLCLVTIWRTRG